MKIQIIVFVILMGIVFVSCKDNENNELPNSENGKPNIVLIMADDVALENLGCYGGDIPTPNIDRLAKTGMKFTRAFSSSSLCTPSRYSIITGQFAGRCNHEEFLSENPKDQPYQINMNTPITEKNITLHKALNNAGYYTGFVGKFHIGSFDYIQSEKNPKIPIITDDISLASLEADSLLSLYQDVVANRTKVLTEADFVASVQWENPEQQPHAYLQKHHLEWITEGAMQFFDSVPKEKPFFLHFNSTALHGPNHYENLKADAHYSPSGRMEEPFKHHPARSTIFERLDSLKIKHGTDVANYLNHYNSGVIYLDDQVGAIMRKLETTGLLENTLVIVTADHNIEPCKSTVYDKGVNVPFVVNWPEVIKPGSITPEAVQFVDFLPTFLELAGEQLPEDNIIDGISFAKVLKGEQLQDREFMFFEQGYTRGISNGKFKYIAMRFPTDVSEKIRNKELKVITHFGNKLKAHALIAQEYHPGYFNSDQLYDLTTDPYEQKNQINNPEFASQLHSLKEAMQNYLSTFNHPFDLADTAFASLPGYISAVETTKLNGTDYVPWWNRKLDFPPKL